MTEPDRHTRIEIQAPPGIIVAPDGFPADPRPRDAPRTFLDAMDVRIKVFCHEQKCALEPELDEDDPRSWSWVAYQYSADDGQELPVSTVRMVPPPHPPHPSGFSDPGEEAYMKLTRVATMPNFRGRGLNKMLAHQAFAYFSANPDVVSPDWRGLVLIHAQVTVEAMYTKLGFVTDVRLGRWHEEGIEHLGMWKRLEVTRLASNNSGRI